jgi:hypothetical protein|tara:strand:+ start:6972 stop:7199 length:228 start_codon:yes stop_codon:yes gene_type:complete
MLPPIHSKDKLPFDIKTIKYPEITGGSASGRVVIKSNNDLSLLYFLTTRIMDKETKKQMKVPIKAIFKVVIKISK